VSGGVTDVDVESSLKLYVGTEPPADPAPLWQLGRSVLTDVSRGDDQSAASQRQLQTHSSKF